MKRRRFVDHELLETVRELRCLACGRTPCDPDHVTTRGAGGDDVAVNVWPLCREHHSERHMKGLNHMAKKYPACMHWLELAGRLDVLEDER